MKKHPFILSAAAIGAGLALAVAAPLSASAHVSISPNASESGSFLVVDFKVPNESATATTTKVVVTLPTDKPFLSVSYIPVAGWTTTLESTHLDTPVKSEDDEITDLVTRVTWTADKGSELKDGQLQQFGLSLGPVPDVGKVTFAAKQFYSDGTTVDWSQTSASAEHPAPVLYVNDEAPDAEHSHGATATAESDSDHAEAATSSASSDDIIARVLGIAGLVVGAVGIVLAVTSRRKEAK